MTRSPLNLAVTAFLGVLFGVTALLIINTSFMMYDDEGYVVLTYQKFIQGERLYTDIFSQYGPVPYLYNQCVSLLVNAPFTHDLGRGLTAFHWALVSVLSCALTVLLSRSRIAGLTAGFMTFGLLWQLNSEPSHPGGLICLLLVTSAFAVCSFNDHRRWHALTATLGATAALLALTKINIGGFFVAGAGAALLLLTRWSRPWRTLSLALAASGLLALPWALMWARIGESHVFTLALQFSLTVLALLWLLSADSDNTPVPARFWATGLAAFSATTLVICLVLAARGTGLSALIQAVLLDPLKHPAHFQIPLRWPASVWPVTAISFATCLFAGWQIRRHGSLTPFLRRFVAGLRIAAAAIFAWKITAWATTPGVGLFVTHSLALLPLFLIPLEGKKIPPTLVWASLLAFTQILHVYPVAGSQMGWGAFLMIPALVTGLHAVWKTKPDASPLFRRMPAIILAVACIPAGLLLKTGWQHHTTSRPLGLPGASHIRAPDLTRHVLRLFTLNAALHGDMLYSRPGMFSYNLWSGVSTPTSKNATHWFWLLSHAEQNAIIAQLEATPRSVLISSRLLEEFLAQINVPVQGPLQDYLLARYKPLFEINGFNFWVPHGSAAVPFGLIETFSSSQPSADTPPVMLQSHIVLERRPASVRLQLLEHPWSVVHDYTQTARRITLEPVTAQGAVLGSPVPLASAETRHGLYRLRVYLDQPPAPASLRRYVLTVLDEQGVVLSESIFN